MDKNDALRLESQLCFPLYAASREFIKRYRPHLDVLDLTYTQYIAMMVFWQEKKISVKELGKRLYLDSGTLTPVLKSLEQKGFVKRYRSTVDERVLIVELTEAGAALQARAVDVPDAMEKAIALSPEEAQVLRTLLNRILEQ